MTYLRLPCCMHYIYTLFLRVSKFSCTCVLACLCAICTLHLLPTTFLSLQYCCSKCRLLNLYIFSEYHTLIGVQCKWCVACRRVYTSKEMARALNFSGRQSSRNPREAGRLGGWEAGRLGGGRLGGWEAGRLGGWETGRLGAMMGK